MRQDRGAGLRVSVGERRGVVEAPPWAWGARSGAHVLTIRAGL